MRKLTDEQLKAALISHASWVRGEKGERADFSACDLRSADLRSADLYGANLYGADLYGADLGTKTFLGACLKFVGACQDSLAWVDANVKRHGDLAALLADADPEWRRWITRALGGEPTPERLMTVVEYMTQGVA